MLIYRIVSYHIVSYSSRVA